MKKNLKFAIITILIVMILPILGSFVEKFKWLKDWDGYFGSILAVCGSILLFHLQEKNEKENIRYELDEKYIHNFSNNIINEFYDIDKSLYTCLTKIKSYSFPTFDYLIMFTPIDSWDFPDHKILDKYGSSLSIYESKLSYLKSRISSEPAFKRNKISIYNKIISLIENDCSKLKELRDKVDSAKGLQTSFYKNYLKSKKTLNDKDKLKNEISIWKKFNSTQLELLDGNLRSIISLFESSR